MSQLKPKRPSDSYVERTLPFSSDKELRETYQNYFGDLRFGKLLEEMDYMAGQVSYKHADGFALDLTIVTAACDRIDLLAPLPSDHDLLIRGQVNRVGSSSMEVGLRIDSVNGDELTPVIRAYFIMVARKDGKAAIVNPLIYETEEEIRRENDAALRAKQRKIDAATSFQKTAPSAEEAVLLHQTFLRSNQCPKDKIPMRETFRQSTVLMHPQDRNIHHKIFGGHLMRLAFELGWNVAHLYCKRHPLFLAVDHFHFYKSVEIGSIVSFSGIVTYTGTSSFIIEVTVEVINPRTGDTEITNISYFTFVAVDKQKKPMPVPKVVPATYEDGLRYIDGHRRYHHGKYLREQR